MSHDYIVRSLKPGQQVLVTRYMLSHVESGPDAILDQVVGSAFEFNYVESFDGVIFRRLTSPLADGRRSYVPPDRRHLYTVDASGFYLPVEPTT